MPRISKLRRGKRETILAAGGDELRRWIDHLGSDSTREIWPRVLGSFCLDVGKSPIELVDAATEGAHPGTVSRTIQHLFEDYDKRMRAKGKKGSTIAFSVKVAKSWLAYNGVSLPHGFVTIHDADRVYKETALTRENERAILRSANRRERAAVALARSGLRPEVQGNYLGTDGLRIRDLPDLKIDLRNRTVSWTRVPARIVVREELSKAKHEFSTFLSTENAEYVAEYLGARLRPSADWKKGENLRPESPVIAPERDGRHFIRTTNIGDVLRSAIRKAGLTARPYVFRTTFQTRLISAETEGSAPHRFVVFWMGHTGEMTSRYGEQRGILAPETIEQMRASFERTEPFLSSEGQTKEQVSQQEFIRLILVSNGIPKEEFEGQGALSYERALEILKAHRAEDGKQVRGLYTGDDATTKIVADLHDGRFVFDVPAAIGGTAVVR
ncbi:MAG: hypothetical protein WB778_02615 [Thermoplasmata archaeon]